MKTPIRISYKRLSSTFLGFDNPSNTIVIPASPRRRYGHLEFNELVILAAICKVVKPKKIFEIGRFDGLTTLCLAMASPEAEVYTLDLPDNGNHIYAKDAPKIARQRWKEFEISNRITEILTDSMLFRPERYKNGELLHDVDLIFIDGSHKDAHIRHDTSTALRLLSPNGILIWHDYFKRTFPAVTAYISELAEIYNIYWIESPGEPDYLETSLCYYYPKT